MKMTPIFKTLTLVLLPVVAFTLEAQEEDPVLTQLRDTLRNTTLQLQNVQTEIQVVNANMEALEKKNEQLQKTIDKLTKNSAAEQAVLKENITNLNSQLKRKDEESARLAKALKEWKDAYDKVAEYAKEKESEGRIRSGELEDAKRLVEQRETQNRELYRVGMEILERYENFGLGKALLAREPFTKLSKVKMQNLVQDYQDDLDNNRISMNEQ